MTLDQEYALIQKAEAGCKKAETTLLSANSNYIRCIVFHVISRGPFKRRADLFQEGCIEFIRALRSKKFDPTLGARFITFASRSIKKAVRRYNHNEIYGYKISRRADELLKTRYAAAERYFVKHGTMPDREYVRKRYPASEEMECGLNNISRTQWMSFDCPVNVISGDDEEFSMYDATDIEGAYETAFDCLARKQQRTELNECLYRIKDMEREVIDQVFAQEMSFVEIGKHWGFSRQRAHQIYKQALKNIEPTLSRSKR